MEKAFHFISVIGDTVLGLSLKADDLGYGHMAARALLMYLILIGVIRAPNAFWASPARST